MQLWSLPHADEEAAGEVRNDPGAKQTQGLILNFREERGVRARSTASAGGTRPNRPRTAGHRVHLSWVQHVPNPEAEASYLTSVAVFPLAPNLHRFRFRWLCVPNPEADRSYPTSVAVSPLAPNLHRFKFRWLCPRSHPSKVDSRFKVLLLQRYVPAGVQEDMAFYGMLQLLWTAECGGALTNARDPKTIPKRYKAGRAMSW